MFYMNDLRPPPPPPFTRLFTSRPFQFPFFNKGKVNGGGGCVEGDSQANTYYQQTKETVKQI